MNDLRVELQPVVELLTGDLFGFEALGRSRSGESPTVLLQRAYEDGRLRDLDRAWRTEAIDTVAKLFPSGYLRFFLNVDSRILAEPGFEPGFTHDRLRERGLSPSRFVLEISEASPAIELGLAHLESLTSFYESQGLHVALDDVGAGWASLRAVISLRPHLLKLDLGVVRGLARDHVRAGLVAAMVDFGRRCGMRVVAEGIETPEDLRAVLAAGVELGQGYFLSRPLVPEGIQLPALRDRLRERLAEALRPGAGNPVAKRTGRTKAFFRA